MRGIIIQIICIIGAAQSLFGQHHLEVQIKGVNSSKGEIAIALYRTSDDFLDFDKAYRFGKIKAEDLHSYTFKDLVSGVYAVAAFYDENSNDQLDTNFIGIPKEAIGTSGTPKNKFGPPRFKNCKVELSSVATIVISLNKVFEN